jgi:hypothetical protein
MVERMRGPEDDANEFLFRVNKKCLKIVNILKAIELDILNG